MTLQRRTVPSSLAFGWLQLQAVRAVGLLKKRYETFSGVVCDGAAAPQPQSRSTVIDRSTWIRSGTRNDVVKFGALRENLGDHTRLTLGPDCGFKGGCDGGRSYSGTSSSSSSTSPGSGRSQSKGSSLRTSGNSTTVTSLSRLSTSKASTGSAAVSTGSKLTSAWCANSGAPTFDTLPGVPSLGNNHNDSDLTSVGVARECNLAESGRGKTKYDAMKAVRGQSQVPVRPGTPCVRRTDVTQTVGLGSRTPLSGLVHLWTNKNQEELVGYRTEPVQNWRTRKYFRWSDSKARSVSETGDDEFSRKALVAEQVASSIERLSKPQRRNTTKSRGW